MARRARVKDSSIETVLKEAVRAEIEEVAAQLRKHRDLMRIDGFEDRVMQANKRDEQVEQAIADREGLMNVLRERGDLVVGE